mmetsp:Transcript_19791/g.23745  ORF Transcript_19791/g.23745 Transcript_19791/m.23745 type:complete len:422 (+) Transcript_19791:115-1380(+)
MRAARISHGLARSAQSSICRPHSTAQGRQTIVANHIQAKLTQPLCVYRCQRYHRLRQPDNELRQTSVISQPHSCLRSRGRLISQASSTSSEPRELEHAAYIREVAAMEPPPMLDTLLDVLKAQGNEIMSASDRKSLHPLVIPLARRPETQEVLGLLRWPQTPKSAASNDGKWELPVVTATPGNIRLNAMTAKEYVHRALVEEDAQLGTQDIGPVRRATGEQGTALYTAGEFAEALQPRLDVYMTTRVGKFPEVMERLVDNHLGKNDETSALITCEWYTRMNEDWGRPGALHADYLKKFDRPDEARDTARVALCSPWWTLGWPINDMVELSELGGRTLQWARDSLKGEEAMRAARESGQQVDERSPVEQALYDADALMDFACADAQLGDPDAWSRVRPALVEKYNEAGLTDVARFVAAADAN